MAPAARDAVLLLADQARAADVVAADAVLVGYARGQVVTFVSGLDGNHGIVRADVDVDGVRQRLFARLHPDGMHLQLVAVVAEPGAIAAQAPPTRIARYSDAWNVDGAAGAAALEAGFAANGTYIDPQVTTEGRAALASHIATFRASLPSPRVDPASAVLVAGRAARFRWVTRVAGIGVLDGEDLVLTDDDGRLTLVCGFWDRDPPR